MDVTRTNTVSGIGSREVSALVGSSTRKAITGKPPVSSPVEDVVELSSAGTALSRADDQSCAPLAPVCELRAAIKAGTFETPERIAGTVEKLLEILG